MDNGELTLDALADRVTALESKIKAFEKKYGPMEEAEFRATSSIYVQPTGTTPTLLRQVDPVQKQEPNPVNWEHVGRVWLPRIFILAILLGVLFAFDAAVKSGLLGKQARIVTGFAASIIILVVGDFQLRKERKTLGNVLVGASIAIALLSTMAGHVMYNIIGTPYSVALGVLFTVSGLLLAYHRKSQTLAVIATVSGFLTPLTVMFGHTDPVFVSVYALVVSTGFGLFAMSRRYNVAFYVAWAVLHFEFICYTLEKHHLYAIFGFVALIQHALVLAYIMLRKPSTRVRSLFFYLSLAGAGIWAFGLSKGQAQLEFSILGALYLILALYKRNDKHTVPLHVTGLIYSVAVLMNLSLTKQSFALGLVIDSTAGLGLALRMRNRAQMIPSGILYILSILLVLCVSPAGERVYVLFAKFVGTDFITYFVATASFFILGYVAKMEKTKGSITWVHNLAKVFRWGSPVALILFLSNSLLTCLQMTSTDIRMLAVSFLWAVLAVGFIIYGMRKDSKNDRTTGIVLLFVTLCKLVFVDLPFVPIVLRSILFIGVGTIGVFASRFFYAKK